ncbi:BPTD_2524 family lipoprotein [Candidimonas nitroreducens]|uniref:Lipoprotein n=1 Tax=Candidimonas nitroreducens TaxID=683354 RepID=A0A225MYU5_9BURK|nr:hypothetical protein [Candidimonas nitroreducens]OWT66232.1 hypothetical protein CEY11_00335 [Candidimonas nitroreducens]
MKIWICGLLAAGLLSGCAAGIQGNSPTVSYTVPRGYLAVYHRAQDQAQKCLRGQNAYRVQGKLDRASGSGSVDVVAPFGSNVVARTQFRALDSGHTRVTQSVWGRSIWDSKALAAMRESVYMDTSECTAYL